MGAAVVAALAVAAGVAFARSSARGAPSAREAVLRYLDALGRNDSGDVRAAFTSGSSRAEIARRVRDYGGAAARGATFRVLPPNFTDAPLAVELTFPAAAEGRRSDALAVRRAHGRWLLIAEAEANASCEPGAVCDATP